MPVRPCLTILAAAALATPVFGSEEHNCAPPAVVKTPGPMVQSMALDAVRVYEQLVERYRDMETYRDTARLVQVIDRHGEEPRRTETMMSCEVADDELSVTTPRRELIHRLGIPTNLSPNDDVHDALLAYDFWLAPHMAIKFSNEPLTEMRPGVCDTFAPTEAEHVTIDDREMVHLELKTGDPQSEDYEAKFDLYFNPSSMLIERIEGDQRMPDGAHCQTTIDIVPESADEVAEPFADLFERP